MIALVPLMSAVLLALAGFAAGRRRDAASARTLGARAAAAVTAVALALTATESWLADSGAATAVTMLPAGGPRLAPIVFDLVALAAVALAPLASHPPRTIARVLLVLACAQLGAVTDLAAGAILAWAASSWLVWRELRQRRDPAAGMFAAFHSAGTVLLALSLALRAGGHAGAGAALAVLAIALRAGLVPANGWLLLLVERAPMGIAVAFLAPQLGTWTHLAWIGEAAGHAPAAVLAAAAATTALLAAGLGLVQDDGRRALGFVVLSQTALVLMGATPESVTARTGAVVTWEGLALAFAGLAMALAAVEARRGPLSLRRPNGGAARTPQLAACVLLFGLATVGFPLSLGFVGEDLMIEGAPLAALRLVTIVAAAVNGITVLRSHLYLAGGARAAGGEPDLRPLEVGAVAVLLLALFAGGIAPRLVVSAAAAASSGRTPADGLDRRHGLHDDLDREARGPRHLADARPARVAERAEYDHGHRAAALPGGAPGRPRDPAARAARQRPRLLRRPGPQGEPD